MGNKLREIFDPNSEYNQKYLERIKEIEKKLIEDKHCSYCVNSHQVPHIEMSKDGGTDTYCDVFNELMLSYPTGQECLFWKLKGESDVRSN